MDGNNGHEYTVVEGGRMIPYRGRVWWGECVPSATHTTMVGNNGHEYTVVEGRRMVPTGVGWGGVSGCTQVYWSTFFIGRQCVT